MMNGMEKSDYDEDRFGPKEGSLVSAFDAFRMSLIAAGFMFALTFDSQIEAAIHPTNIGRWKMDSCRVYHLTCPHLGRTRSLVARRRVSQLRSRGWCFARASDQHGHRGEDELRRYPC